MGSFQEDINCPICNSPDCFRDSKWRTGEEYISCSNCGYKYVFKWKRDENGDFVLKDKNKGISAENLISEITEVKNPYGSYEIHYYNTPAFRTGSIESFERYEAFKRYLAENREKDEIKKVIVHRFVDGKFISEKL
uniref:hypothetical protein n=1 Tax=uncultured Draconibacterium sp. TaxID=1573823 RepID=UPI003216596E